MRVSANCTGMVQKTLALLIVLVSGACTVSAGSVNVGLHAAWTQTATAAEATTWIAHNIGDHAVIPFLKALNVEVTKEAETNSGLEHLITQRREHELLKRAFLQQPSSSLVWDTLSWVLQARQYTPFVYLHYSIANETMGAFATSRHKLERHQGLEVFAVKIDASRSKGALLSKPTDLDRCDDCPVVTPSSKEDHLSFALGLPRDILISEACHFSDPVPSIFLYADLLSPGLGSWIEKVESRAANCDENIVLRFWDAEKSNSKQSDERPSLQGFVVQADLKSTEYKVIDDRVFSTRLFDDCPFGEVDCTQTEDLNSEGPMSIAADDSDSDLKLGTYTGEQALHFLTFSSQGDLVKALQSLRTFTEDKPSVVRTEEFSQAEGQSGLDGKALRKATESFRNEIGEEDYLFINGRPFEIEEFARGTEKLLGCLSTSTVSSLHMNLAAKEFDNALDVSQFGKRAQTGKRRLRFDLKMIDSLGPALVWFNDLLKDSLYKKWKSLDIHDKASFTAYQDTVRKHGASSKDGNPNFANFRAHHLSLVVLVDPGDAKQFVYASIPETIVRADMPIRIGIVMVPNGRVSSLIAASFHYFLREKGRRTCAQFLQMIRQVLQYLGGGFQEIPLSEQVVELAFSQISSEIERKYSTAAEVLEKDEEIAEILRTAESFALYHELFSGADGEGDRGIKEMDKKFSLLGVLNGVVLKDISADIIPVAMSEQKRIVDYLTYLSSDEVREIDEAASDFDIWVASDPNLIVVDGLSREMRSGDQRMTRFKSKDDVVLLSSKVVFALRKELRDLEYLPSFEDQDARVSYSMTVWLAAEDHEGSLFRAALSYVEKLAVSDFAKRTNCRVAVLSQKSELHWKVIAASDNIASKSDVVVVVNGRIVVVSDAKDLRILEVEIGSEHEEFEDVGHSPDLKLLQSLFDKDIDAACEADALGASRGSGQPTYQTMASVLDSANMSALTYKTDISERTNVTALSVLAIVNPLEDRSFMVSGALSALQETYGNEGISITLVLAPRKDQLKKHFDAPTTYARFVIGSGTNFHDTLERRIPTRARFMRLAKQNVFTIAVEPPRAWFVSSFATNYDMYNVVLSNLPTEVQELNAEYELRNLIVEGACIDENESPPQGLKLVLSNEGGVMVDTLVMANLGYFQLKVPSPGRRSFQLAPGPSSKIFAMKAMEMYSGQIKTVYRADKNGRLPILVESLVGAGGILLRVERKPGMEGLSVLDPDTTPEPVQEEGIASKLKAKLSKLYKGHSKGSNATGKSPDSTPTSDTINVFSVASGHLYERFLKIMMSSATKHASRPIKFWLLENYLSPSFKKFLPLFAKKLGCEVGMVTYKWPGWLRAQTEKQRIIWAYKILFLDVLFPLDVGRIIFVDSDQVLRGDLAELMDIDLKGAPYEYVPFCDSRKEVEGYRFWKQGFWKETLRGQKYRISALYVVDLNRFRETTAGDTLRFVYQSLSADPNSLSNLDQDLPNYASVSTVGGGQSVPIFDLPAEWLWCESWCDDESKQTAKAIDLCNNPMTKEPKLVSARRIIAEWTDYDDTATRLTEEIYGELVREKSPSHAAMNDSDCSVEGQCDTARIQTEDSVKEEL